MSLTNQNARILGDPKENRRSLGDFMNFETLCLTDAPVSTVNRRASVSTVNRRASNVFLDREWRYSWSEEPGSPHVAQTPRPLVPDACFPPNNSQLYGSFSEQARPGTGWSEQSDNNGQGITDLVTSMKSINLTPQPRNLHASMRFMQFNVNIDASEPSWKSKEAALPSEPAWAELRDPPPVRLRKRDRTSDKYRDTLQRRASFSYSHHGNNNGIAPLNSYMGLNDGVLGPFEGSLPPTDMVRKGTKSPAAWAGTLPSRCVDPSGGFSPKVFLGGLPWEMSEDVVMKVFDNFSPVHVEFPSREGGTSPRGYAYVTFSSERSVRALLASSRRDGGDWYYRVPANKARDKEVQVIPWALSDSSWVAHGGSGWRLEPSRTVFVGALHGCITASALATIMNDLFAGVVYAGIDTDKNKYPIGSGRVTFSNVHSYIKAVCAAYVEIQTDKFTKKVQVDPYLEDSMCSLCNLQQGPYFCRDPTCFRYFCRACWAWQHSRPDADGHCRLMRSSNKRHEPNMHHHYMRDTPDGAPSPSTSGTSGSGTSEEPSDDHDAAWTLR